jgi:hypothetical protein
MRTAIFTRLAVERDPENLFFATQDGHQWLADALDIASKTSIVSIENLVIKPSFWFLLIDKRISIELQQAVLERFVSGTCVPIKLILTDGWSDCGRALEMHPEANACKLQVRLDYDDLLHRSYLSKIIELSRESNDEGFVISPSTGIIQELHTQRIVQVNKRFPAFLALYRWNRTEHLSIFSYDHDSWPIDLVREITSSPLWMQTITGKNIANQFGRGWLVSSLKHLKRLELEDWTGESRLIENSTDWLFVRNIVEALRDLRFELAGFFGRTTGFFDGGLNDGQFKGRA